MVGLTTCGEGGNFTDGKWHNRKEIITPVVYNCIGKLYFDNAFTLLNTLSEITSNASNFLTLNKYNCRKIEKKNTNMNIYEGFS